MPSNSFGLQVCARQTVQRMEIVSAYTYQLVVQIGQQAREVYTIRKDTIILGRDAVADIVIHDRDVSRVHARITYQESGYIIQDLGSTTGTFLDGKRLTNESTSLSPGQIVTLGSRVMITFATKLSEGIPSSLYNELRTTLLDCGPFSTDSNIKRVFVDERLSPWRNQLPQANNPAERVESIIDFLHDQHNSKKENALFLLICVLSERLEPGDDCHHRLAKLADKYSHAAKRVADTSSESASSTIHVLPQSLSTPIDENRERLNPQEEELLRKALTLHKRSLYHLREQKAKFGSLFVPLHIINQIDDEQQAIEQIEAELKLLTEGKNHG